jgi:hypothetical protein
MRSFRLLIIAILLCGCAKKPETPRPPFDAQKLFLDVRREQIQLLAVKHNLPPGKMEQIAWHYYKKHDIAFSMLSDPASNSNGKHRDISRISEGVAATVIALAGEHSLPEDRLAAFIADLRLFESVQK